MLCKIGRKVGTEPEKGAVRADNGIKWHFAGIRKGGNKIKRCIQPENKQIAKRNRADIKICGMSKVKNKTVR